MNVKEAEMRRTDFAENIKLTGKDANIRKIGQSVSNEGWNEQKTC